MALFFRKKKKLKEEAKNIENLNDATEITNEDPPQAVAQDAPLNSEPNGASDNDIDNESLQTDISSAAVLSERENQSDLDIGLEKSRSNLFSSISGIFASKKEFDEDLFDELEDVLLASDIGVEASLSIIETLRRRVKKERIKTEDDVMQCLQEETQALLSGAQQAWNFNLRPYIILMVGVNGVGKTTTTAKIAHYFQSQGKKVVLAAGDTFRAAAVEQLEQWGKRLNIQVISQGQNADAAAVAHDAFSAALARDADVLIIDTAGRLHTQTDLMEQLEKIIRVLKKIDSDTPHEVMQVLDATTGQNALSQLKHFKDAVGVNSICLTKLDGSAKGGVALALTKHHGLPIRFVGVGEAFEDLKAFDAEAFTKALIHKPQ